MSEKCKHCGSCCLSGVPCAIGQIWFDITEKNPTACPACVKEDGLHWCSVIKYPQKWLGDLFDGVEWKCEAMAEIFATYIGIGEGCGHSYVTDKIHATMKEALTKKL